MRNHILRPLLLASLLVAMASCKSSEAVTAAPEFRPRSDEPQRVRADLFWLASDEREGRQPGKRGNEAAAKYIRDRFIKLGLRPLKGLDGGYFQYFTMPTGASPTEKTKFAIGDSEKKIYTDFVPNGSSAQAAFAGDVVFCGYGITLNAQGTEYNDFAGIDVKGKVALVMRYGPRDDQRNSKFGNAGRQAESFLGKARAAQAAGATALLVVNPPAGLPENMRVDQLERVRTGGGRAPIPVIQITPDVANQLLSQGGQGSLADLQKKIDSSMKPASVALAGVKVKGEVEIKGQVSRTQNIIAVLPGTKYPDEYVVVGAHMDHLGRGELSGSLAPGSTDIHNGADDNASGTTGVLALAERMVMRGAQERSIIFMLFSGEEQGLLGSAHFANNPPIPLEQINFMLNLDMIGRMQNNRLDIGGSGTAEVFEGWLAEWEKEVDFTLRQIGRGGFGPSDHASFARKQIPVLFFFTGMHPDYHRPSDDPDKINYDGMMKVIGLADKVLVRMANTPKQKYVNTFDRESALQPRTTTRPTPGQQDDQAPPARRASLGIMPDMAAAEGTGGVRAESIIPGSAAEAAGLKAGDILVEAGGTKIGDLTDLQVFLSRAQPGQTVKLAVMRDGKRMEVDVTLREAGRPQN